MFFNDVWLCIPSLGAGWGLGMDANRNGWLRCQPSGRLFAWNIYYDQANFAALTRVGAKTTSDAMPRSSGF